MIYNIKYFLKEQNFQYIYGVNILILFYLVLQYITRLPWYRTDYR